MTIRIANFTSKIHEYQRVKSKEISPALIRNFNYALGRHTYVVYWCVEQIMEHGKHLNKKDKEFMIDRLKNNYLKNLEGEHDTDIQDWKELLEFLEELK